uniref:Uncharacterized protein n=1 Tax=Cacopsylla melanoneura TaxID=428564 RepID=A0A8D8RVF3_9HEMI
MKLNPSKYLLLLNGDEGEDMKYRQLVICKPILRLINKKINTSLIGGYRYLLRQRSTTENIYYLGIFYFFQATFCRSLVKVGNGQIGPMRKISGTQELEAYVSYYFVRK